MDWGNVTYDELLSSLKEVDWTQSPRPPTEFFSRLSLPKTGQKLQQRLKCNVYHYRSNYAIIQILSFIIAFIRRPSALLAVLTLTFGVLCLNDSFATSLSDRLLRYVRKVHPPLAHRIRATSGGHSGYGSSGKRTVKICGVQRIAVVAVVLSFGLLLLWYSAAHITVLWALLTAELVPIHLSFTFDSGTRIDYGTGRENTSCALLFCLAELVAFFKSKTGSGLVLAHAVFRTPNLKTRLASAREEFRAVWRGYQQPAYDAHDYNL